MGGINMASWNWKGASWWKFDFHAHTPASDDYGKGPTQSQLKNRTPREWILDYMRAGIDCVAITDHNTGAWIDKLMAAFRQLHEEQPEGYRPIYLFPGVEISVHGGVHVLAIFGPDTTSEDISALLGAVDFQGTKGCSDGVTTKSFVEVVRKIKEAGGIAIPAHVDRPSGLFSEITGTTLAQILDSNDISAIEVVEPLAEKPILYSERKLNWTEVLGSDSHHPMGPSGQRFPGSHFTWVKMEKPCVEGLRLALLDGLLSVRRSDAIKGDPNKHASLILESVEVSHARYMGRDRSFELQLNPWLNGIIGGRGTGKSSIVEFMRLALRREEELPEELKDEFGKYKSVYQKRGESGLLTDKNTIRLIYRKNEDRFRIQWCPNGTVTPIEEFVDGEWKEVDGNVQERFPVRVYSQKHIYHLANQPLALLKVIDDSPEVDRRTWDNRWKEKETRYLALTAQVRSLEAILKEEPVLRGQLDDVNRELKVLEEAQHGKVLREYQVRMEQKGTLEDWERNWADIGEKIRQLAVHILPGPLDEAIFDSSSPECTEIVQLASRFRSQLNEISQALFEVAARAEDVLVEWRTARDGSGWKKAVDSIMKEYSQLQTRLSDVGASDPSLYHGQLVERRQHILGQLKQLDERRQELDTLRSEAQTTLQDLTEMRRQLSGRRRKFLDDVLRDNKYVRIRLLAYGARETVEPDFRELIQVEGGKFEKDIGAPGGGGLLGDLYSNGDDPATIEEALQQTKFRVKAIATDDALSDSVSDKRFIAHIRRLRPEALDRLDLWFPEDSLEVEFSQAGDRFRPLRQGSPGQKTAALLAFLLSYGDEPLILDQPEDDLDNRLIYDLIVSQIREVKQRRQIIVVTHNANIVVNGDAELVAAFAARGGQTRIECVGSLQNDQVRDTICAIMEGGREALERRYRRIALESSHTSY